MGGGRRVRARAGDVFGALPVTAQDRLSPMLARFLARRGQAIAPDLSLPNHDELRRREDRAVGALLELLNVARFPFWFIPAPEPHNIRIGFPSERREDFLEAVRRMGGDLVISWQGATGFRTTPSSGAAATGIDSPELVWVHHESRAASRRDALDAARAVQVEFWTPDGSGGHEAPVRNPYAAALRTDDGQVMVRARTGHDLPTFEALATPDIREVRFPVDAVYLWVDDADPAWRERRDRTVGELGADSDNTESLGDARFRQHDELRYSLRSLSQFAPWIRHVFLVTDQQRPAWINEDCPRISIVDHRELFGDRGRLPTYNSHALSARLHHIPGLAEHFLYLNDDVFFGRRTGAELWFDGNGQTRFHYTRTTTDATELSDDSPLAGARNHTFALVKQLTGRVRRRNLMHGPHAFSRQLLLDLEARMPEEFERTWGNQLRSGTDLVIERLASQVGHFWGRSIDSRRLVAYEYFNTGLWESGDKLRAMLTSRRVDTFCINDGEGPVPVSERMRVTRGFLAAYFPTPSEFER